VIVRKAAAMGKGAKANFWSLSNGRAVSAEVADTLINNPSVDMLGRTWRFNP
jgi:hypothetical protein